MNFKYNWIINNISKKKKGALVIPFYNECRNKGDFIKRLDYFNDIGRKYSKDIDVLLVNDGSADDSDNVLIDYVNNNGCNISIGSIWPNGRKVGAQNEAIKQIDHDYIIFSDFDTNLLHLEKLDETFNYLDSKDNLMGCYFKLYPANELASSEHFINEKKKDRGNFLIRLKIKFLVKFQIFEYALSRSQYKIYKNDENVTVMPGAGCIYKRTILEEIFSHHSYNVSGEDRETSLIGQSMGYGAYYQHKIHALTNVPEKARILFKQRVRWSLGYLENLTKEHGVLKSIFSKNDLGKFSLSEFLPVLVFYIIPLLLAVTIATKNLWWSLVIFLYLTIELVATISLTIKGKEEMKQVSYLWLWVLGYPFMRTVLELPCWWASLYKLITKKKV